MKNLIVNADDLGWTEGVNRGIAEAHRNGIVTSASLLANGAAFMEAAELARTLPGLGIGVHLNLSDGAPVAEGTRVESLVGANGEFHGAPRKLLVRIVRRKLAVDEVEREWDAQIGKIREAGLKPTHIDGHKHVQMLPGLFEIALKVAKRHGIAAVRVSLESPELCLALLTGCDDPAAVWMQGARAQGFRLLWRNARRQAEESGIGTADYFCGIAQTGALTKEGVLQLLWSLPDGTTELMCHPGYADEALRQTATRLQDSRQKEIEILTDPEIRNVVASQAIRLIDYGSVAHQA